MNRIGLTRVASEIGLHSARCLIRYSVSVLASISLLDRTLTYSRLLSVDVPMSRVKFNVNTEYAYLQNFKILQSASRPLLRAPMCMCLTQRQMSLRNTE